MLDSQSMDPCHTYPHLRSTRKPSALRCEVFSLVVKLVVHKKDAITEPHKGNHQIDVWSPINISKSEAMYVSSKKRKKKKIKGG